MRTSTNLLLMVGLALTVSTSAEAIVSIDLVQVGGTYDGISVNPGDTLVLNITYGLQAADNVTILDVELEWDSAVSSFNIPGSTEAGSAAWSGGAVTLNPVAGGPGLVTPNRADGWEKTTLTAGGATTPCVFGACTSLGTAAFVLSGTPGAIWVGSGTVIADGTFTDITGISYLGRFPIIPEPTTASLVGLGLVGLAAVRRRRTAA